jgi:purine-nucleoside phosphorylase
MAQAGSTAVTTLPPRAGDLPRAIEEARAFIASRSAMRPEVAIVLGTGLGRFADAMSGAAAIPYDEIPGFPTPSVGTHAGEALLGTLGGKRALVLSGRAHYY